MSAFFPFQEGQIAPPSFRMNMQTEKKSCQAQ